MQYISNISSIGIVYESDKQEDRIIFSQNIKTQESIKTCETSLQSIRDMVDKKSVSTETR